MRTSIRTASKTQEEKLISNAKKVSEDFEVLLPQCLGKCIVCPFSKSRKKMGRIQQCKDDRGKLAWFSRWGDPLSKAYAATLLLALDSKAPRLAVAKYPFGDVAYAHRGGVKKEIIIGIQYFDDPHLRLIGFIDIVRKKNIHIYSIGDGLLCAGKESVMPKQFVDTVISLLKILTNKSNDTYSCRHLLKNEGDNIPPHLKIKLAGSNFLVCMDCAKESETHTIATINQRMLIPHQEESFRLSVVWRPKCAKAKKCPVCAFDNEIGGGRELSEKYISGAISDHQFITECLNKNIQTLAESRTFVNENNCYGEDAELFIASLKPNVEEANALRLVLSRTKKGIAGDKISPSKILADNWDEFGEDILFDIVKDRETAKEIYKKTLSMKDNPSQILKEALASFKQKRILSELPRYKTLHPIAEFADEIARAYKTGGTDEALRLIEKRKTNDIKVKSVAYAFLLHFGKGSDKRWQYSKIEIECAQFLEDYVKKLLESEPDSYHDSLQKILIASGSTEIIKKDE
jgi:hypothetical protein